MALFPNLIYNSYDDSMEELNEKDIKKKSRRRDVVIYGRHPVLEALKRQIVKQVFYYRGIVQKAFLDELTSLCEEKNVQLSQVDQEYLTSRLGKSNHQGVLAEVNPFEYSDFNSILQKVKKLDKACILILAHLEDPGNLGSILRSAAAFDISGVILPNKRSATVNATVAKTSAGTLGMVPVALVPSLRNVVNILKKENFWVVGSDTDVETSISGFDFPDRSVIIIGGEAKGVPQLLLEECDYRIRIDINRDVESLNVSAATAIFLQKAYESFLKKGIDK